MSDWLGKFVRFVKSNPKRSRHFDGVMGTVRGAPSDAEFYKEVERIRLLGKIRLGAGIVLLFFSFELLFIAKWMEQLRMTLGGFLIVVGLLYVSVGRNALRQVHREFYRHRIVPYQQKLKAKYEEFEIYVPSLRAFRRAEDLWKLERSFLEQVRFEVGRIEHEREVRRWPARNEKLKEKMLQFIQQAILPDETKVEIEKAALEAWESVDQNPQRRKAYVSRVENYLRSVEHEHYLAEERARRQQPALKCEKPKTSDAVDHRVMLLEAETESVITEKARALRDQALITEDRRERIRLLKLAIHTDRSAYEEPLVDLSKPHVEVERSKSENKFIVLDEVMEKSFTIEHLVPPGINAGMVKEILLELLDPGSGQRRFQKAYRPETRLRRRARYRYETWVGQPFDPRAYKKALDWLVQEGVLRTKPKRDDAYSLSANTLEAKSETSRELISAVLALDRKIRSL